MNGVLIVDKPAGMTSHDVVDRLRRLLGVKRIGHAGTLDPDATGVMVLGVGRGARLLQFLSGDDKEYVTDVVFGSETTTMDASGVVTAQRDASNLDGVTVERALADFRGEIEQIPPMVSAVKVGGEALYKKARRGEEIEREPRAVRIDSLILEDFEQGSPPRARLRVHCSKGTYIRVLAHDLGRALGTGAHVATLRRTASGPFTESMASPLDDPKPTSMEDAVAAYPKFVVDQATARSFVQGKHVPAAGIDGVYAVVGPAGLVAMARDDEGRSRSVCVVAEQ